MMTKNLAFCENSVFFFWNIYHLLIDFTEKLSPKETLHYIQLLQELVPLLPPAPTPRFSVGAESDSDDDERMDTSVSKQFYLIGYTITITIYVNSLIFAFLEDN